MCDNSTFILSGRSCCHRRRIRLAVRCPGTAIWLPWQRRLSHNRSSQWFYRRAGDGSTGTNQASPKKRNGSFSSWTFLFSRIFAWLVKKESTHRLRLYTVHTTHVLTWNEMQTFFVKYLDQTNITNAYISGMKEDLKLSAYSLHAMQTVGGILRRTDPRRAKRTQLAVHLL